MAKKSIIVACATGVATSTVICNRIEELCKENGIEVSIVQCKVPEISAYEGDADLIVTSGKVPKQFSIPAVKATSYIIGIGAEATDQEIINHLK